MTRTEDTQNTNWEDSTVELCHWYCLCTTPCWPVLKWSCCNSRWARSFHMIYTFCIYREYHQLYLLYDNDHSETLYVGHILIKLQLSVFHWPFFHVGYFLVLFNSQYYCQLVEEEAEAIFLSLGIGYFKLRLGGGELSSSFRA